MTVEFVNTLWATLTVGAQLFSLFLILGLFVKPLKNSFAVQIKFIGENGMLFAGTVALLATIGSLLYSNYFNYAPCELCWIQRICMYPLAFILLFAYYRKEKHMDIYGICLALAGAVVALYHHFVQLGLNPLNLACGTGTTTVVSCAKVFVFEFGYITMPLMSFSVLIFISLLLVAHKRINI